MSAWGTLVAVTVFPPARPQESTEMPRLGLYSLIVCVLAVAAAVVSFVQGSWLGVVWVLLAGLSSNMCWYYMKRGRAAHQKR
jgi:Flp pilus assembly protein TadB